MRVLIFLCLLTSVTFASVADPQLKTDHPWYPGELSCSTFDRLFATQSALYKKITGRDVNTDEDKALASWYWRNLHFAHGEEGRCDWFGEGKRGDAEPNRDYWTGLFAHGFGLCGTTHAQYCAEIEALLGHCRGRCVGVTGHNSFEVYLTGGAYGAGRWDQARSVFEQVALADEFRSLSGGEPTDLHIGDRHSHRARQRKRTGNLVDRLVTRCRILNERE